jgi:O-methyltransferase
VVLGFSQRYVGNVNLAVEAGNATKTETRENLAYSCGSYISDRYLDLMRDCLTRSAFPESWDPVTYPRGAWQGYALAPLQTLLRLKRIHLCRPFQYSAGKRSIGDDWPPEAETMIGLERLANLRKCCISVVRDGIPGDFCETGVWRGGACIYMRAVLEAMQETARNVWVCDSFEGLPKPTCAADRKLNKSGQMNMPGTLWRYKQLAVSLDEVRRNFARYGLLDDRVRFVKGWFGESLPRAPIQQLSVLRLDGDLYESTWDAMVNLYPKLSAGGYLIVDDYESKDQCGRAIHDYRDGYGITDSIERIDGRGVFWQRSK